MCLILVAWQVHPRYPLVLAANRDEFWARRSAPAAFWPDHPEVLAGRDLEAGGTWLGINRYGRFAALTNIRDPAHAEAQRPTRGALVADYLCGETPPRAYLAARAAYGRRCNGYNLLLGEIGRGTDQLWWASNVGDSPPRALAPGIYGLSNALLDTPWPKLLTGKNAMAAALALLPDETAVNTALFAALADPRTAADELLPQTGIPLDWERALSATFIRAPGYGTRASCVLTVGAKDDTRSSASGRASAAATTTTAQASGGSAWRVSFDEKSWAEYAGPDCASRVRHHISLVGSAPL